MKVWISRIARSKTMIFALLISISGAIEASSGFLKTILTPNEFGFLMMGIGILVAILRIVTTQPLDEK